MKTIIKIDDFDHIIREITSQGIRYSTDANGEAFIDFQRCHLNHISSVEQDPILQDVAVEWKPVGQRDVFVQPPYIEFFTHPLTRFEFSNIDDCHQLRHRIRKLGWATMDLS
jgi:hypothetical protein